jgi:hypothetical protein
MKIQMRYSEAINRRTDNAVAKRKKNKMIYKAQKTRD